MPLRALARVNLAAIERNVARLRRDLRGAGLCAVVKADGYGHGACRSRSPRCGRARAGWRWPPPRRRSRCALPGSQRRCWSWGRSAPRSSGRLCKPTSISSPSQSASSTMWWPRSAPDRRPASIVKFDTGMGRLGTRDLDEALNIARRVANCAPATVAGRRDDPFRHGRQRSGIHGYTAAAIRPLRRGDAPTGGRAR